MNRDIPFAILALIITCNSLNAQVLTDYDSIQPAEITLGWVDEAATLGYIAAPTVVTLMFISTLVPEWNAGYVGIPATAMILAVPPIIYAGGRSVNIWKDFAHPRAKLGWTLYALSIVPTSLALYGFTTDWGPTIPLTITSAIFGTASIIAMTSYARSREKEGRKIRDESYTSLLFGLSPLPGGAMATLTYKF